MSRIVSTPGELPVWAAFVLQFHARSWIASTPPCRNRPHRLQSFRRGRAGPGQTVVVNRRNVRSSVVLLPPTKGRTGLLHGPTERLPPPEKNHCCQGRTNRAEPGPGTSIGCLSPAARRPRRHPRPPPYRERERAPEQELVPVSDRVLPKGFSSISASVSSALRRSSSTSGAFGTARERHR